MEGRKTMYKATFLTSPCPPVTPNASLPYAWVPDENIENKYQITKNSTEEGEVEAERGGNQTRERLETTSSTSAQANKIHRPQASKWSMTRGESTTHLFNSWKMTESAKDGTYWTSEAFAIFLPMNKKALMYGYGSMYTGTAKPQDCSYKYVHLQPTFDVNITGWLAIPDINILY